MPQGESQGDPIRVAQCVGFFLAKCFRYGKRIMYRVAKRLGVFVTNRVAQRVKFAT